MKRITAFRTLVQMAAAVLMGAALFADGAPFKLLAMAALVLCGAFTCGWLCPCGLLQDLGSRLGKGLGIVKRQVPVELHRSLVYCRYFLAAAAAFWMTDLLFTLMGYDPRGTALGLLGGNIPAYGALGVLGVFTAISLFYERPFCRYFCIEGAKLGVLGLLRVFTLRRNNRSCVQCGRCDRACPMQINVSQIADMRSPQCISCLECAGACPVKNTLRLGLAGFGKRTGETAGTATEPVAGGNKKSA